MGTPQFVFKSPSPVLDHQPEPQSTTSDKPNIMATATESPMLSSPNGNMMSAFSPYTEFSMSPNSPAMPNTPSRFQSLSARDSVESSSLHPHRNSIGKSPASEVTSPSDMVGPSPVTSNGTETTEIEDDEHDQIEIVEDSDNEEQEQDTRPRSDVPSQLQMLASVTTNLPAQYRQPSQDEPTSVVHAPQNYLTFNANTHNDNPAGVPPSIERSTPRPFQQRQPNGLLAIDSKSGGTGGDKTITPSPVSPPPISTDHPPTQFSPDQATPRAQTRQEVESFAERTRLRSSSANSLDNIPEADENVENYDSTEDGFPQPTPDPDHEVNTLKTALHECWTLCNTLANLSSSHRERAFSYSSSGSTHEKAWKCCWRLCIKLYEHQDDEGSDFHCRPTLDLCREFCQSLFDVRQKKDEMADSVLRVSFELNNHLFNTHDRNLPEAFRERTLDFYITLCHRLMKQRSDLAEETDKLLRACWSLAEMLFSLRQNRLEGKDADEELLGSAVQACWELCNLFREGWTQIRPERGTPRPSQTTFTQTYEMHNRGGASSRTETHSTSLTRTKSNSSMSSMSSLPSLLKRVEPRPLEPETPCTEFEDTPISPEDNSPSMPNIMVLGVSSDSGRPTRWSSNSSQLSGYSEGSNKTSSTAKTTRAATGAEDVNLTRLKILILKAAMNVGFSRDAPTPATLSSAAVPAKLQAYVKALPLGSFGSLPWQSNLLASYKDLVLSDPTFRSASTLPQKGKRASATEVSKSVGWMMQRGQYLWLKDLFRLVFGFGVEDAEGRKGTGILV